MNPLSRPQKLNTTAFLFIGMLHLLSCSDTKPAPSGDTSPTEVKGKLSADLVHNPRSLKADAELAQVPIMIFDDTLHDFGRLKDGETVTYEFGFTNKGQRDLIISEAKGSCGCTIPVFPQTPITAGQHEAIQVTFNSAGKKGYNEKTVMVITNATPSILNLTIRAEVY